MKSQITFKWFRQHQFFFVFLSVCPFLTQSSNISFKTANVVCPMQPENHTELKAIMVYLRMLVTFTSTTNWKALRIKAGEQVLILTLLLLIQL